MIQSQAGDRLKNVESLKNMIRQKREMVDKMRKAGTY
jgi:hypothetical protein